MEFEFINSKDRFCRVIKISDSDYSINEYYYFNYRLNKDFVHYLRQFDNTVIEDRTYSKIEAYLQSKFKPYGNSYEIEKYGKNYEPFRILFIDFKIEIPQSKEFSFPNHYIFEKILNLKQIH